MAVNMSKQDQDKIAAAQAAYNAAKASGNKAGMDAAHAQAEAIRNGYGYSGGGDGSQYIPKPSAPATSTGSGSSSGSSGSSNYSPNYTGSSNGVNTYTNNQDAIKNQMNQNSILWSQTTDPAERERLHQLNQQLASQLGAGVSYDGKTGLWTGDADQLTQAPTFGSFSYGSAPTYQDSYSSRIDQMLNDILNRDKFSYDAMNDPLYAQYKEQYNREGERAMKDTMGALSARTGGMASSYASSAATQANQAYAQQLADKIPELYQMAYQMYLDDIDMKVQDLGLLNNASNTAYNRYRDTMGDWRDDRNFAYGAYRDDIGDQKWQTEFNYGAGRDQIADGRYDQEWNYNVGRDQIADDRYKDETAWDRNNYNDQLAYERAMDRWQITGKVSAQDAAILGVPAGTSYAAYKAAGGSGGGGSKSSSSGNGGGQDYAGLFRAAMDSGNPKSFISNNYKRFGFTSSTGLFDDYSNWSDNPERQGHQVNSGYESGHLNAGRDNYTVSNPKSEEGGWIAVDSYGRLSFSELESALTKGTVKAVYDDNAKKVRYVKA